MKRQAARDDETKPDVELIDRHTSLAMRRLEASGMLRLADGASRVLHQSPELVGADQVSGEGANRAAELLQQAERCLQMAKVLAAGGFPDEGLPLLARAISHATAAKLSNFGELPADASMATPAQTRALVERRVLPPQTLLTLALLGPGTGVPSAKELERLFEAVAQVLAACDQAGNSLPQAA